MLSNSFSTEVNSFLSAPVVPNHFIICTKDKWLRLESTGMPLFAVRSIIAAPPVALQTWVELLYFFAKIWAGRIPFHRQGFNLFNKLLSSLDLVYYLGVQIFQVKVLSCHMCSHKRTNCSSRSPISYVVLGDRKGARSYYLVVGLLDWVNRVILELLLDLRGVVCVALETQDPLLVERLDSVFREVRWLREVCRFLKTPDSSFSLVNNVNYMQRLLSLIMRGFGSRVFFNFRRWLVVEMGIKSRWSKVGCLRSYLATHALGQAVSSRSSILSADMLIARSGVLSPVFGLANVRVQIILSLLLLGGLYYYVVMLAFLVTVNSNINCVFLLSLGPTAAALFIAWRA